jgi:hypothetical protein
MLRTTALAVILLALPAHAQTRGWFPRGAGECGWVHGRYAIYNGSGISRIWVIGTNHMLNRRDDDEEEIPPELDFRQRDPTKDAIYGDFFVCAIERHEPGEMQQVHIRRTRNLVVAPFRL